MATETHIYIYIYSSLGLELPHARRHTLDSIGGVHFGADSIVGGGVSGALGPIGLNMGGPSRGWPEKYFVEGKVSLFREFQFWKDFWI